jgi:GT2 family glycosyltransferase
MPLVSVVILNFRRRTDLVRTLRSVESQNYGCFEIIVVDNDSGDSTPEYLAREFPQVRVVSLDRNLGCGGRNRGVETASGEIVVMLDNDVCLETGDELTKIVKGFADNPSVTALVFKVLDEHGQLLLRDWCHPRSARRFADAEFETCFIAEGACAFRRKHYLDLGGYYEPFYVGCEGWDLALRMLEARMPMLYFPHISVRHYMSKETRTGRRPYYFYIRNNVWIAYRNYPTLRRWGFIAYSILGMFFYCFKSSSGAWDVVRGLWDGFASVSEVPGAHLSERAWRHLAQIRAQRPTLWKRVLTHLRDTEM